MPSVTLSDYFCGDEEIQFSHFRIPRQLITHPHFKPLSVDAKLLYGMLLNRMSLSAKNSWHDNTTQVAVWASCGQLSVPGTSFTAGRAALVEPTSDAPQGTIFVAENNSPLEMVQENGATCYKVDTSRSHTTNLNSNGEEYYGTFKVCIPVDNAAAEGSFTIKAIPALERMGVKIIVLRSEKTYVDLFTGRVTRGPKKGMVRSFPICGKCAVQRDCKVRPIQRYQKTLPPGTVQYIGIAKDEQERLLRLEGGRQVSLLAKYNLTERDAWQLCGSANVIKLVDAVQ